VKRRVNRPAAGGRRLFQVMLPPDPKELPVTCISMQAPQVS
jgi:hypothetical protein